MREPDMQKLDALVGRLVGDVGAAISGALVVLGDRVGIFKAMGDGTPLSVRELSEKTGARGTLPAGMAQCSGRRRLCHLS